MNEKIWEQINLEQVNQLVKRLPGAEKYEFSDIAKAFAGGDFESCLQMIFSATADVLFPGVRESKSLILGILLLGILAMLLQYSFGLVKSRQVGQLAYYLVYLMLVLLLLAAFGDILSTAKEMLELIKQFIAVLVPAYCLSVSLSGGGALAASYYEIVVMLLLGIDYILAGLLLPLTQSYVFLVVINGLDDSGRMKEFVKLFERILSWTIKICLMATVMVTTIRSNIAIRLDGIQKTAFQKAVGALPGIGDMSESVTEILVSSAEIMKSSIGSAAMVFIFFAFTASVMEGFLYSYGDEAGSSMYKDDGQKSLCRNSILYRRSRNNGGAHHYLRGNCFLYQRSYDDDCFKRRLMMHNLEKICCFFIFARIFLHLCPNQSYEKYISGLMNFIAIGILLAPFFSEDSFLRNCVEWEKAWQTRIEAGMFQKQENLQEISDEAALEIVKEMERNGEFGKDN